MLSNGIVYLVVHAKYTFLNTSCDRNVGLHATGSDIERHPTSLPPVLPRQLLQTIDEPYEFNERTSSTPQRQQHRQPSSQPSQSRPSSSSGSTRTLRRTPRLEPRQRAIDRSSSVPASDRQREPVGQTSLPASEDFEGSSTPPASTQILRSSSYWPKRTTRISKHTAQAILYALEAVRGDPEGRLGSPEVTPSQGQPQQWKPKTFTPTLAEENASMSDMVGGAASNGRTQNGSSRLAGPVPQYTTGGDRVRTPTDIMKQRRDREAKRKEENDRRQREQEEERQRRAQEENTQPDRGDTAAGVAPNDATRYRRSGEPRRSTAEGVQQPNAERRSGDRESGGSTRANVPSTTQPTVHISSTSRTEIPPATTRDSGADIGNIAQPRTRIRGATLATGRARPVELKPVQATRAVSAAAGAPGGSMEANAPQTRQGSKAAGISQSQMDRPPVGQRIQEPTVGSQQRSNTSSFPHAFERWEQLSSHWEGLTSFWIRRLEQNQNDLEKEPLNQQMARQVTDLSAAGANLFHAVVELQRLRASSERKFQRWFFETRTEQERAREIQAKLEEQLRNERQAQTEATTTSARSNKEMKAVLAAKDVADVQVREMRRELMISREEARRAWEELGHRVQEERDRTTSLKSGQPTLVGGVQVVPMVQGASRQGSTNRPSTREGAGTSSAPPVQSGQSGPIESPTEDEPGYTTYDPARSETDTDPFTEGGRANPQNSYREPDLPPLPTSAQQQTSNISAAAVQAARAATQSVPQQSASHQTRTTTTTTISPADTYLRYPPGGTASNTTQPPTPSFYQHQGTSLHPDVRHPGVSEGDEHSYIPSNEDTFSEEDWELDSHGEVRRDAHGHPIPSQRRLGSEDSDEYDVQDQLERERMYGRSYGSGIAGVDYGSGPTGNAGRARHEDALFGSQQAEDAPVDYSGSGFGAGWEAMPRHHHPTRLSDVLEEDERSRTSPSRASQNSRGLR